MKSERKKKKIWVPYEVFSFELTNDGINEAVALYEQFCEKQKIDIKEMMMGSISFDAALHEIENHSGEIKDIQLICGKRWGKPYVSLRYKGDNYDPLVHENATDTFISSSKLLQGYDLSPTFSYKSGICQIDFPFSQKESNPLIGIAIAFVLAIIAGNVALHLPNNVAESCLLIMDTVESTIFTLITMSAGPLIFLAVITGISNVGDIKNVGSAGRKLINHIMVVTIIYGVVSFGVSYALCPFTIGGGRAGSSVLGNIIDTLESLIPGDIVSPFANGEFAKIVVIAILMGFAMLMIGNSTNNFSDICNSLYSIFSKVTTWFTKLIPVALFTMLTKCIMDGSFIQIMSSWKMVVVAVLICAIGFVVRLIYISKGIGLPIGEVFSKCFKCMLIGFSTASSCCAITKVKETCSKELNADENLCSFLIPINTIFYGPGLSVNMILIIVFFCNAFSYELSVTSVVMMVLLSCLFSVISPPVAGGVIAAQTIVVASIGLPKELVGMSMIFLILLDYVSTGFKVGEVTLMCSLYGRKGKC